MSQPTDTFKATLDHIPDTTGRDGAIDFAAKVEASHAERVVLDHGEDFIVHAGGPIELTAAEGSCRSCCRTRRCDRDRWSRRAAGARTKGVMRRALRQSRAFEPELAGMAEDHVAVLMLKMIELQTRPGLAKHGGERRLAHFEGLVAQVAAVQLDQVEGKQEYGTVRASVAQPVEARHPVPFAGHRPCTLPDFPNIVTTALTFDEANHMSTRPKPPPPRPSRPPPPPPSRLKQALATLTSDLRRDVRIFIAAIVFLVVVYVLAGWLA
jgi:hypothetical protein